MTELPGREEMPQRPPTVRKQTAPAAAALVGHLVALIAAVVDPAILNIVVIAGVGCSVIAIAAFPPAEATSTTTSYGAVRSGMRR